MAADNTRLISAFREFAQAIGRPQGDETVVVIDTYSATRLASLLEVEAKSLANIPGWTRNLAPFCFTCCGIKVIAADLTAADYAKLFGARHGG